MADALTDNAPAAAPVTPAAAPPKAAPAAPAPAAPVDDTIALSTPIDWVGTDGSQQTATLQELIDARDKANEIGDMDVSQLRDIHGALSNDPESKKRLLQRELDSLTAPEAPPQNNEQIAAMEQRINQLTSAMQDTAQLTQQYKLAESTQYVKRALENETLAKAVPWAAAQPELASRAIATQLMQLDALAKQSGQQVSPESRYQQFIGVNNLMQQFATPFGGALPPAPTQGQTVTAERSAGSGPLPAGVVQAPKVTAAQLLEQRAPGAAAMANPQVSQVVPVPNQVPTPANQAGSPAVGVDGNGQQQRFTTRDLLANVRSKRDQGGLA